MPYLDLVIGQLADPFRIGLVVALVVTAERTRAQTGMALPLALGVLFIAVIIPTTMQSAAPDVLPRILAGIVSTGLLLAAALVGLLAYRRFRG